MKKIIYSIIILLLPVIVSGETITVSFESCIDGDTAHFIYHDQDLKTRFLAINAPEIEHDDKKADYLAAESKNMTCSLLKNATKIQLEYDNNSAKEDKYGRTLAWVWIDDELLQEKLVENGLAKVDYIYDEYLYVPYLCQVQKKAYKEKTGIWQKDNKMGYCSKVEENNYSLEDLRNNKLEDIDIKEKDIIILCTIIFFIIFMTLITLFIIKRG